MYFTIVDRDFLKKVSSKHLSVSNDIYTHFRIKKKKWFIAMLDLEGSEKWKNWYNAQKAFLKALQKYITILCILGLHITITVLVTRFLHVLNKLWVFLSVMLLTKSIKNEVISYIEIKLK